MSSIGQTLGHAFQAGEAKAIALAKAIQASFLAFNAAAIAKVGVVFDSVAKLSPAAVASYTGYAVLGAIALGSGVLSGYVLKNRVIDLNKGLKPLKADVTEDQKINARAAVGIDDINGTGYAVYTALGGTAAELFAELLGAIHAVNDELTVAKNKLWTSEQAVHDSNNAAIKIRQDIALKELDVDAAWSKVEYRDAEMKKAGNAIEALEAAIDANPDGVTEDIKAPVIVAMKTTEDAIAAYQKEVAAYQKEEEALEKLKNELKSTEAKHPRILSEYGVARRELEHLHETIADHVVAAILPFVKKEQIDAVKAENRKVTGSWSYFFKNAAVKTAGVGLALFSTVTTASTIGFVAGTAVPVAAAYAIGAIVPAGSYYLVKNR